MGTIISSLSPKLKGHFPTETGLEVLLLAGYCISQAMVHACMHACVWREGMMEA
jgi:hypothetical protein